MTVTPSSVALALGAPLRTMYHLIDIVGSPTLFLAVTAVALLAAAGLARVLRPWLAVGIGVALFASGVVWYLLNLSTDPAVAELLRDTAELLGGNRILRISNVRLWVISFVPAPVFLTTYFALRRWYVTAVLVSGTTLGFFVLTTDATVVTTVLGLVGGVAAVGFGTLDSHTGVDDVGPTGPVPEDTAGVDSGRRAVLEQLAAIIVIPAAISRLVSLGGSSLTVAAGEGATVEGSLVEAGDSLTVQGDISLSATVRYTVESTEPRYWRVGIYDRYTGDGWVRTGSPTRYDGGELSGPPGESRSLRQSFEAESAIGTVPAAWKPVAYSGDVDIERTTHGGFQPVDGVEAGDSYTVSSELVTASPRQLRAATGSYPDWVTSQYLQLPDSTPARVGETTAQITANAETPYQTALVVSRWLRNNREYSLDVERPERNVADRFLHAMDRGYCVYFATKMVVMLRTQGVPARMTVGYTPGERVSANRWVVRGLNSHAWVEVYISDHGWIQFDPTPSGPRQAAEQDQLEAARMEGADDVDTNETNADTDLSTPESDGQPDTETPTPGAGTGNDERNGTNSTPAIRANNGSVDGSIESLELPTREETVLGLVALLGTAAGIRRTGLTDRLARAVRLRYQRRVDPETDVERAFQRAMTVLADRHRPREDGETVRAYLAAADADDRIHRLATLRERALYAGDVSAETADEAVELANELVSER